MKKLEFSRFYLFSDYNFDSKILKKELTLKIFNQNPLFGSFFIDNDDDSVISDILSCFYGYDSEAELIQKLINKVKKHRLNSD